jgi:DNA-binding LacI/PurR family transcriptional regulator
LPITRRLDGLLIISLMLDDQEAQRLVQHRLPTVLIEGTHPQLAAVEIDNVGGGKWQRNICWRRDIGTLALLAATGSFRAMRSARANCGFRGFLAALERAWSYAALAELCASRGDARRGAAPGARSVAAAGAP